MIFQGRTHNFSLDEKKQLIQIVKQVGLIESSSLIQTIISNSSGPSVYEVKLRLSAKKWHKIATLHQEISGNPLIDGQRRLKSLKFCWKNMKARAKKHFFEEIENLKASAFDISEMDADNVIAICRMNFQYSATKLISLLLLSEIPQIFVNFFLEYRRKPNCKEEIGLFAIPERSSIDYYQDNIVHQSPCSLVCNELPTKSAFSDKISNDTFNYHYPYEMSYRFDDLQNQQPHSSYVDNDACQYSPYEYHFNSNFRKHHFDSKIGSLGAFKASFINKKKQIAGVNINNIDNYETKPNIIDPNISRLVRNPGVNLNYRFFRQEKLQSSIHQAKFAHDSNDINRIEASTERGHTGDFPMFDFHPNIEEYEIQNRKL